MSPTQKRGPWSHQEDELLMQLVQVHGPLNWVRISSILGCRTPKQCRERYHQNLKPSLNHSPITQEEGERIERLVQEIGKRWAEIARRLHGRSDNAVKNWWNGSQNRLKRHSRRQIMPTAVPHEDVRRQSLPGVSTALPLCQAPFPISPGSGHPQYRGALHDALPSPCSSEQSELDPYANYTTSPAGRSQSFQTLPSPNGLPPLREWRRSSAAEPRLPSLSLMGQSSQTQGTRDHQNRLPPILNQIQLPTAPNSPTHQQQQPQQRWQQPTSADTKEGKTSGKACDKMKLASLLT
ncbi:hypothetical protein QQS21_001040 [Conoideocrella luteorostrata]|uniref:Uncharacterized protein n=1 Tax=Conoideocrella luteorostrata TaxID=1105319 RepID=A0AAJ0G2C1_9HYPO|nr:hypothetical protein QQS21_001040 [Conoideocrella luteorostrata]